jgi:hypothetical protein|uniref:Uncharacterized protein n=1 Tax=viral metagenome TaxID=1070528 RepID=A0A6C0JBH2_9ZZZZ
MSFHIVVEGITDIMYIILEYLTLLIIDFYSQIEFLIGKVSNMRTRSDSLILYSKATPTNTYSRSEITIDNMTVPRILDRYENCYDEQPYDLILGSSVVNNEVLYRVISPYKNVDIDILLNPRANCKQLFLNVDIILNNDDNDVYTVSLKKMNFNLPGNIILDTTFIRMILFEQFDVILPDNSEYIVKVLDNKCATYTFGCGEGILIKEEGFDKYTIEQYDSQ